MANNIIDGMRSTGTSSGTGTFVASYPLLTNTGATLPCTAALDIVITGRDTGNGDSIFTRKGCLEKVTAGNAASVVGSIVDIVSAIKDVSLLLASVSVTASGGNILVTCTGVTGRSIEWMVTLTSYIN